MEHRARCHRGRHAAPRMVTGPPVTPITASMITPRARGRPADVALLAVHLMINTAVTGATYDIDGGEQLVPGS